MGKVILIQRIPNLGYMFHRGKQVTIGFRQSNRKGNSPTLLDLHEKQVNHLGGSQSKARQNRFHPGFAFRVDAGPKNGGVRHGTNRARMPFRHKTCCIPHPFH